MSRNRIDFAAKLLGQGRITPEQAAPRRDAPELPQPPADGNHSGNATAKVKAGKYRNKKCVVDGEKFDSQLEYRVCDRLRGQYGPVNVIRQVSIPLGEKRIRPDFLIIHERFVDGTFRGELVDAKGMPTKDWEVKAAWLKDAHRLTIRLIKK